MRKEDDDEEHKVTATKKPLLSFGLQVRNANGKRPISSFSSSSHNRTASNRSKKKTSAFDDFDDNDELDDVKGNSAKSIGSNSIPPPKPKFSSLSEHRTRQMHLEALQQDPNIFNYDNPEDKTPRSNNDTNNNNNNNPKQPQKPKYIQNLMAAASLRKLERERVTERKVQKEREAEKAAGLPTTEKFVTSAYKQKMLELEQYEKEQNRLEELEKKRKVDFSSFYKDLLNQGIGFAGSHIQTHETIVKPLETITKPLETITKEESTADKQTEIDSEEKIMSIVPVPKESLISISTASNDEKQDDHKLKKDLTEKRNDSAAVLSARERYLARKNQSKT